MRRAIRVAIVGCGWAGMRHAAAYKRCGAVVRWAIDREAKRAEVLGKSSCNLEDEAG